MSEETVMTDQLTAERPTTGLSRRNFFAASTAAGAALLLVACGGDDEPAVDEGTATTAGSTETTEAAGGSGDVAVARFAAGLEVLAVNTYKGAADAAAAGKLGTVPPAVGEYVRTALAHHQAHLEAWGKVLQTAGGEPVTEADPKLAPVVAAEFAKVKDAAGAAKLALLLEDIAAQTYLKALPTLESKEAIKLAGSIQAVDQQHVAILLFALGMYPVPEVFQKTDKAATP